MAAVAAVWKGERLEEKAGRGRGSRRKDFAVMALFRRIVCAADERTVAAIRFFSGKSTDFEHLASERKIEYRTLGNFNSFLELRKIGFHTRRIFLGLLLAPFNQWQSKKSPRIVHA